MKETGQTKDLEKGTWFRLADGRTGCKSRPAGQTGYNVGGAAPRKPKKWKVNGIGYYELPIMEA